MATIVSGEDVLAVLDRPIAFHRVFVEVAGGVAGAVMLSQMVYWQRRCEDPEGWWFKSREDWTREVGATRREQETARAALMTKGVLQEETRGIPRRLYFRLDVERLSELVSEASRSHLTVQQVTSDQQAGHIEPASGSDQPSKRVRSRPASRSHVTSKQGGSVPSLGSHEETSEETSQETSEEREKPAAPAVSLSVVQTSGQKPKARASDPPPGPVQTSGRVPGAAVSRVFAATNEDLDRLRSDVIRALFPEAPVRDWSRIFRGQFTEWERLWRLCAGDVEEAVRVALAGQARCTSAGQAITLQALLRRYEEWCSAAYQPPPPQAGGKRDVAAGNAALLEQLAAGGES